jgi:hypothetical protein
MVMSKGRFLGRGVLVVAGVAVLGGLVMLLWNAIVPELFASARSIDYLHALGLLVLCRILFGGFRGHGGWHGRHHWGRGSRWSAMTPEERERFRRGMPWGEPEARGEGKDA